MAEIPLYVQVRNSIRNGIESGLIKSGSDGSLPCQQEFADKFDVSLITVKRALKELELEGLVKSKRGKGLILLKNAKEDKTQKKMLHFGVAFFERNVGISNTMPSKLIAGIENYTKNNNTALHIVTFPMLEMSLKEDTFFANFSFSNLDGLILLSPASSNSYNYIKSMDIPFVSFNILSEHDAVCCTSDFVDGAYCLYNRLFEKGCRNILTFVGSNSRLSSYFSSSAYRMVMKEKGIEIDKRYISYEDYDIDAALIYIERMMSERLPLDAVVGFDDIMAARIYDYFQEKGIENIFVAGVGNFDNLQDKVKMTIEHNYRNIGYEMARILHEMVRGVFIGPKKNYYQTELIDRTI